MLIIVVLTVNEISCNDTISSSTMKSTTTGSSCTLNNVIESNAKTIWSSCDNETIYLFIKESHFQQFPHVFEYYPNLQSVDVTYAGIEHIESTTFENAVHLTALNMEGSNIPTIQNYLFSHANNLSSFDLSNSSIHTIETNAFVGLSNLKKLDLSFNHIRSLNAEIFHPLSRLEHIRLTNNNIEIIDEDTFARNTQLKWAYFGSNKIVVIAAHAFIHSQLISLDLGFNELQGVDVSATKLKTLIVSNNNLIKLNVPSTVNEIHAENNSIAVISSELTNNLTKLYLSSNCLLDLKNVTNFGKLVFLDLGKNHFEYIDFSKLKSLIELHELKLAGNKLSEIDVNDVITNLPKLAFIQLSTKHWSDKYIGKLASDLKSHNIVLVQDRSDIPDAKPITTVRPSTTSNPTSTSPNITELPINGSVEMRLNEIDRRLNNIELNEAKAIKDMEDIEDKMMKASTANNAKYNAMVSTFKTYEIFIVIIFIAVFLFVLYKAILYSRDMLSGIRYRRAQSSDPIFSEQDL